MQQNLAGHYCMDSIVETIEIYDWTIIHLGRKLLKLQADNEMIQILKQMHFQVMCSDLSFFEFYSLGFLIVIWDRSFR